MSNKVLIVGGSSYVGSYFSSRTKRNHELVITFFQESRYDVSNYGYKIDLSSEDPFSVLNSEEIFDCVIWLAQSYDYSEKLEVFEDLLRVNIVALEKCLNFCVKSGVKKFIFFSSGSVYGSASEKPHNETDNLSFDSHYGFSKYCGEFICNQYASHSDLKVSILRPFAIFGEGQKDKVIQTIRNRIISEKPVVLNSGIGMIFNPIYIKDLVPIMDFFIEREQNEACEIINIAGDEVISLKEISANLAEINKKKLMLHSSDKPITYSIANIAKLKGKFKGLNFTPVKQALINCSK